MMNIKLALIVSVSAYALQMNPVYASLLSSPPASILDTNIHTTTLQSSAPASFSSVILGLDPRIQVKQGFLNHLDASVRHWHDSSFLTASVCFITDTGACSGNSFGGGANTEDGGHGAPGGGTGDNGGSGDGDKDPDYELDNAKRCKKEGYTLKSCNSVQDSFNRCPYDNSYFEKCVCKSGLVTCTKPQYGVGDTCGGKYASCQTDNPRACREDGYTNTCPSGQKLRKDNRCKYDSSFGICCSPSCPQYTSTTSSSYGTNGTDGCGYACYYTCQIDCPSGTSETNPGGCGGSTSNGCANKTCYYAYKACCTPAGNESGCNCYSCSDGCGGTRTCCSACPPPRPTCKKCWHSCRYTSDTVPGNITRHMAWCSYTRTCSDGSSSSGGGVAGYVSGIRHNGKMCYDSDPECTPVLREYMINQINSGAYDKCVSD